MDKRDKGKRVHICLWRELNHHSGMPKLLSEREDNYKMKRLYIIGNGFDLYHDIPSGYADYRNWLESHHMDILSSISNFFEVLESENEWNDFEKNLGEKDILEYSKNVARESWPDFSSDEFRDRDYHASEINAEVETEDICQKVTSTFGEWIDSLPEGSASKKIHIQRKDSFFINFNYTRTLENLYKIPSKQILHIHGEQGKDNYVLGHGKSYQDFIDDVNDSIPAPPDNMPIEEYEKWYSGQTDMFVEQAVHATANILADMQKDCKGIIEQNAPLFKQFKNLQEIYIFGFSFSEIDIPYLNAIASEINMTNVRWTVSCFRLRDKKRASDFFSRHAIPKTNVNFIKLEDLHPDNLDL